MVIQTMKEELVKKIVLRDEGGCYHRLYPLRAMPLASIINYKRKNILMERVKSTRIMKKELVIQIGKFNFQSKINIACIH